MDPYKLLDPNIKSYLPDQYNKYKRLLRADRAIDEIVNRKRREFEANTRIAPRTFQRKFRVSVYYKTFKDTKNELYWTLKIKGHLNDPHSTKGFSSFFRRVVVELDKSSYERNKIEWTCYHAAQEIDGFEITRKCKNDNQNHVAIIKLFRNYSPERFTISETLEKLVSYNEKNGKNSYIKNGETRQEIQMKLWDYIKKKKLIKKNTDANVTIINNDQLLKNIFNCDVIALANINNRLEQHLIPVQPIMLKYSLSDKMGETLMDEQIFDVEILAEEDMDILRQEILDKASQRREETKEKIKEIDKKIHNLIELINNMNQEKELLIEFSKDPSLVFEDILISQTNDLQLIKHCNKIENNDYFSLMDNSLADSLIDQMFFSLNGDN